MSTLNKEIIIDSMWGECQQRLMIGETSKRSLKFRPTILAFDECKEIGEHNKMQHNNRKELHEKAHERRKKNFAMQRVARNIANEEEGKKLELFYQNTVLLLTGYKPIKIAL